MADNSPAKKRRVSEQRYLSDYTAEWPVIVRSKLDSYHAYCVLCKAAFDTPGGLMCCGILRLPSMSHTNRYIGMLHLLQLVLVVDQCLQHICCSTSDNEFK